MVQMEDLAEPDKVSDSVKCPICMDLLTEPVFAGGKPCQHVFCKSCIEPILQGSKECPSCRGKINSKSMQPHLLMRNLLDELVVVCPSKCGWTGRADARAAHAETCPLTLLWKDYDKLDKEIEAKKKEQAKLQQKETDLLEELKKVGEDFQASQEACQDLEKQRTSLDERLAQFPEELRVRPAIEVDDDGEEARPAKRQRAEASSSGAQAPPAQLPAAYENLSQAAKDRNNKSLLDAAESGNWARVRTLLTRGICDPNSKNTRGWTALHYVAKKNGSRELAQRLLAAGANANAVRNDGRTPLHLAVGQNNNEEVVEALLAAPCDVNLHDRIAGETALQLAAAHGHKHIVEKLLAAGADINGKDKCGSTALHRASGKDHIEVVKFLVEQASCEVDAVDTRGATPLAVAASGQHRCAKFLMTEAGANVDGQPGTSIPVMQAVMSQNVRSALAILECLKEKGANVDATSQMMGNTALHVAVRWGEVELVSWLIKEGKAQVNIANSEGVTPFNQDILHNGHQSDGRTPQEREAEIKAILTEAGAH